MFSVLTTSPAGKNTVEYRIEPCYNAPTTRKGGFGMPISENKKASNARYTEKCDYINVRPLKAQGQKIRAAAAAAGRTSAAARTRPAAAATRTRPAAGGTSATATAGTRRNNFHCTMVRFHSSILGYTIDFRGSFRCRGHLSRLIYSGDIRGCAVPGYGLICRVSWIYCGG